MSRGRNRKKQKEARLVSDQKEAAQKGITVAELRQQRKDKNTAIVVGIASLIPAFRGAKLATKGVTSGYKFLKGLFKLSEKLFEIKVVEATDEAPLWNDDVLFFNILNKLYE